MQQATENLGDEETGHGNPQQWDSESLTEYLLHNIDLVISSPDIDQELRISLISCYVEIKYEQFKLSNELTDEQEAIEKQYVVLKLTSARDAEYAKELELLSSMLGTRYERTGQAADARIAISKIEEAISLLSHGDSDLPIWLNHLGNLLIHRYERTGQVHDLNRSIEKVEEAIRIASKNQLPPLLTNLANRLEDRYDRRGLIEDLEAAIQKATEVVNLTPKDDSDLPSRLNNLGTKLHSRYERVGRIEDLTTAIELAERVIELTPKGHPDRPGRLRNLGSKLGSRYERIGKIEDLELAIEHLEEAVELTPQDDSNLPGRLNVLGNWLQRRHQWLGRINDLDRAILKAEQAVSMTPDESPDLPGYLSNLGSKLQMRYVRTDRRDELELAIDKTKEAIRLIPKDHPDLLMYLSNCSSMLQMLYERTGWIEAINTAIGMTDLVISLTPAGHTELSGMLSNLGTMLHTRYEHTRQVHDLERAIEKAEAAIQLTSEDQSNMPMMLRNLGRMQLMLPDTALARHALPTFLRAWHCDTGIPSWRLLSAVAAIDLFIQDEKWLLAANLAVEAISLLSIMNRRSLSRNDQQNLLSLSTGLAAKACSLLLQSGRSVKKSLEVLELGRGIITGLIIDDRHDISHLQQRHPDMVAEYNRLRAQVNDELRGSNPGGPPGQRLMQPFQAVKQLEDCIRRIRRVPGQERFLLGQTAKELQEQAHDGPLVVINVTDIRSDAIIVEPQGIKVIGLQQFTAAAIRSWSSQKLTHFTGGDWGKKNRAYRRFLLWVWETCVQVVFANMDDIPKAVPDQRPELRVWWIGTGAATTIPFHAAGDHSVGSVHNTFSHAISSYTPTVKVLKYSRRRLARVHRKMQAPNFIDGKRRLAVIAMPETPGQRALPAVGKELSNILDVAETTFSVDCLICPDAARVKNELPKCHIFHFAGHGTSDPADPSQGCLLLQKVDDSSRAERLSVNDISRMNLPNAQLAYLSACSTAENSAVHLADEVIHLVSGFQVAGFGHVVGALWPSDDEVCVAVARRFYESICVDDDQHMLGPGAAKALHSAVVKQRNEDTWRKMPLAWAQFVHFGA